MTSDMALPSRCGTGHLTSLGSTFPIRLCSRGRNRFLKAILSWLACQNIVKGCLHLSRPCCSFRKKPYGLSFQHSACRCHRLPHARSQMPSNVALKFGSTSMIPMRTYLCENLLHIASLCMQSHVHTDKYNTLLFGSAQHPWFIKPRKPTLTGSSEDH